MTGYLSAKYPSSTLQVGHAHNNTSDSTHLPASANEDELGTSNPGYLYGIMGVEALIGTGIIITNSFVLASFVRSPKLRSKTTNYYLLQLALADFMAGMVTFFHIAFALEPILKESEWGCLLYYCAVMHVCTVSMMSLMGITLDRFVAILLPLYYRVHMGKRRARIYCVVIHLLPLCVCVVLPLVWHNKLGPQQHCDMVTILPHYYMGAVLIPIFLFLVLAKVTLYSLIYRYTKRRVQTFRKLSNALETETALPHQQKAHQQNVALAKTGALVVSVFVVCWLPFFVVLMVQVYWNHTSMAMEYTRMAAFLLILLCSVFNPLIYVYRIPAFRREMFSFFCPAGLTLDLSSSNTLENEQGRNLALTQNTGSTEQELDTTLGNIAANDTHMYHNMAVLADTDTPAGSVHSKSWMNGEIDTGISHEEDDDRLCDVIKSCRHQLRRASSDSSITHNGYFSDITPINNGHAATSTPQLCQKTPRPYQTNQELGHRTRSFPRRDKIACMGK